VPCARVDDRLQALGANPLHRRTRFGGWNEHILLAVQPERRQRSEGRTGPDREHRGEQRFERRAAEGAVINEN